MRSLPSLAALTLTCLSAAAHADEGYGKEPEADGARTAAIATGAAILGGGYVASTLAAVGGIVDEESTECAIAFDGSSDAATFDDIDGCGGKPERWAPAFIPVAGPFITIGTAEAEGGGAAALAALGAAQVIGLVTLVTGLALPEVETQAATLTLTPRGNGVSLDASF